MYLLLANKKSGNGGYLGAQKKVESQLKKLKIRYKTVVVEDLSQLQEILPGSLSEQTKLVIIMGGDSTVSEIINLIPRRHIPLAIVPVGASNTLSTSLGIDSVRKALEAIKQSHSLNFRLGRIGEKFFLGSLQIAPRKNILKKFIRRPGALHQLLNVLGFTEENDLDAIPAEIALDYKLKFSGEIVSLVIKLENKAEEKRGMLVQIITRGEKKGDFTEHLFHTSSLTIKAETSLPVIFGNDTIATTPATIKALSRTLPMVVSKEIIPSNNEKA